MHNRTILHADANGFFASVECAINPELKNVPMAVGGDAEKRHGIILAKNELAKKYNIQTAETIHSAKRKCPDLVIVPPHHTLYREYSKRIFEIYTRYTELVESFGLDEAWLDVTHSKKLFGDGVTIANELRQVVKKETGITISVGVSFCKVFAKLGSDYKKPDATTVFDKNNWKSFIFPMPVSSLLYVGKSTNDTLDKLGIKTIGQLAATDHSFLINKLGKMGDMLYLYANGLDNSSVKSIYDNNEVKSVGNSSTFAKDICGEEEIRHKLASLAESVAKRLRNKNLKCTTVQVQIKTPQFKTIQRQRKLEKPTYLARELRDISLDIIKECWSMNAPIRLLGVTGSNLVNADDDAEQISLFDEPQDKRKKTEDLEKTIDQLKKRFGENSVISLSEIKKSLS